MSFRHITLLLAWLLVIGGLGLHGFAAQQEVMVYNPLVQGYHALSAGEQDVAPDSYVGQQYNAIQQFPQRLQTYRQGGIAGLLGGIFLMLVAGHIPKRQFSLAPKFSAPIQKKSVKKKVKKKAKQKRINVPEPEEFVIGR
jgi:hypothetical protein